MKNRARMKLEASMKIGILGAGSIACKMASTIRLMSQELWAIGSRSLVKAEAFARKFDIPCAYGSYEELASDPEVQLIYIATPHSAHLENILLCLENGKNVLCEKAFTLNAEQARKACLLSEKKGLLLAEAIWTRYLPSRLIIDECLKEIGDIRMLTANLSYCISTVERLTNPSLGGGALLDVGVYPLNFMAMCLGTGYESMQTSAALVGGVDQQHSITYVYPKGAIASIFGGTQFNSDQRGLIYGTEGSIEVENINNPTSISLFDKQHQLIRRIDAPKQLTGFEYEVQACIDAINKGLTECSQMPHAMTIAMMEMMDAVRSRWHMSYPGELDNK